MQIFETEKLDGLEEKLTSSASITYASVVEPFDVISKKDFKNIKSIASYNDEDLYYVQSILVSSSWNKNDDIFDPAEVWKAKATPEHKPTNLEHNEGEIIGHIISNWPITDDGDIISEDINIEDLPSKFHILTGSVIYKAFTTPELKERAEKLIAEIETGNKYVSMECFFNGFDYGVTNKNTGEYKVLARDENTAYLTKHLKAYGGLGEHEDYKIGRVLRNITFSGKGFVDKPANPDSVIFTKELLSFDNQKNKEEKNNLFTEMGVFSNQANIKENDMNLETELADLKQKVEAMNDCSELVKEAYASVDQYKTQASELEASITQKDEALVAAQAALDSVQTEKEEAAKMYDEEMKKKKDEMEKMKAELDAANEIIAAYKDKEAEMARKEKMMNRKASLLEAGLDDELATASVEKFESLSDEAFDGMVSLLAAMKPKKEEKKEEVMNKKMASEESEVEAEVKTEEPAEAEEVAESVDASTLEEVEVEDEVNLSVGSEDSESEIESTRAALIDFVKTKIGKKVR
jgi:hypothetical protein